MTLARHELVVRACVHTRLFFPLQMIQLIRDREKNLFSGSYPNAEKTEDGVAFYLDSRGVFGSLHYYWLPQMLDANPMSNSGRNECVFSPNQRVPTVLTFQIISLHVSSFQTVYIFRASKYAHEHF